MSVNTGSQQHVDSPQVQQWGTDPLNWGELEDPSGVGHSQSQCGDWVRMTLKLDDAGRIAEARFLAHGCMSALASSAALTELAKGKTPDEAARISSDDVSEFLGGLPQNKTHCSALAWRAYIQAVEACRA
jgi:NifU-like protein